MTQRFIMLSAVGLMGISSLVGAKAQTPVEKVEIVAVTGCVSEKEPGKWALTNATDPEPSIANAPMVNETIEGPTRGDNEFSLIGVSEFDLPSLKGEIVLVKALLIEATPVRRLNVTSITERLPSCDAPD